MRIPLLAVVALLVLTALVGPLSLAVDSPPVAHPAATAADWSANPDAALAAVLAQAKTLVAIAKATPLLGWLGGALLTVLGVCKFLPGVGGPIADGLYALIAPWVKKQSDQATEIESAGFRYLVQTIEALPAGSTLADLRDKAARTMPDAVKQAVNAYLTASPVSTPLIAIASAPTAPAPAKV